MSLHIKYRPADLNQVKGNADIIVTLESMLDETRRSDCPHAFLLHGQTGCGKTTIARIIANKLGCIGADYIEVDSGSFRGIDTVREIRTNSMYKAIEGEVRVWVIDECHKMTNDAQNALLKILEDTPSHVYFVLCTTEPQKLIATIKGRCSQFQVKPLTDKEMFMLLKRVAHKEGIPVADEVYDQIVSDSLGLPRNALQILEQVLNVPEEQQLESAKQTAAVVSESIELCRALIKREKWSVIAKILVGLKEKGEEAESIRRVVLGYCQSILLKEDNILAGLILEEFINPFYDSGFPQLVFACYTVSKN